MNIKITIIVASLLAISFIGGFFNFAQASSFNYATTGTTPYGITVDSAGNVYTANNGAGTVTKIVPNTATTGTSTVSWATVGTKPYDIVASATDGKIYVTDNNSNYVSQVDSTGTANNTWATLVNGGGSTGTGITIDSSGNLYAAGMWSYAVTKITPAGTASHYGSGSVGLCVYRLAFDAAGNLYTGNGCSNTISKIAPGGATTSSWATTGANPYGVATDPNNNTVYSADFNASSVTKVTSAGVGTAGWALTTVPGHAGNPSGMVSDAAGNLYTVNRSGGDVVKITPAGVVSLAATTNTAAGTPTSWGIAIDSSGNLYVSNSGNNTVTKVMNPTITQVTPIATLSPNTTPTYVFSSDSNTGASIIYGGSCSSATTVPVLGTNTIVFNALALGTYTNCTIQITDGFGSSNVLSIPSFTIASMPSQPLTPVLSNVTTTSTILTWSTPSSPGGSPITNYKVYRNSSLVATTNSTTFYFSDSGLSPNTSYSYYVTAVNTQGESLASSTVSATTLVSNPVFHAITPPYNTIYENEQVKINPFNESAVVTNNNWSSVGLGSTGEKEYLSVIPGQMVAEDGLLTKIKVALATDATPANLSQFRVKIWRKVAETVTSTTSYTLVGESENLAPQIQTRGVANEAVLATPFLIKEGDYVGYRIVSTGSNNFFYTRFTWEGTTYTIPTTGGADLTTPTQWYSASSIANYILPIELYVAQPDFVFIGDSIVSGNPLNFGIVDKGSDTTPKDIPDTFERQFSNLTGYTYVNYGHGSWKTSDVIKLLESGSGAAFYSPYSSVKDLRPRNVVVYAGTNDLGKVDINLATYETNMHTIIDTINSWSDLNTSISPATRLVHNIYVMRLLPFTAASDITTISTEEDTFNTFIDTLPSIYPNVIVYDPRPVVGVYRADGPAGNLWGLNPAYSAGDGIHYNALGNSKLALSLESAIDVTGPVVSGVTTTAVNSTDTTTSWTTSERSTSRIEYGTSHGVYGQSIDGSSTNYDVTHSATLTGVLSGHSTYYYRLVAKDFGGNISYSPEYIFSKDATLSNLVVSQGTLSPTFSSGTTSYTDSVANSVTSLTVTPTVNQANATVTVNGTPVTSGSPSGIITLDVGNNTVLTVVTAQNGVTTDTYTIVVTRAPGGGTASYPIAVYVTPNGSISPGSQNISQGGSYTFNITPYTGYQIADVLVDNVSIGAKST